MKTKRFRILAQTFFLGAVISMFTFTACNDDDDEAVKDPVASFQYEVSATNALEVVFTNYSQDASSYAWNFGDGETSVEENPTHIFAAEGTYTVTLTATNSAGVTDDVSKDITLTENAQALLTGETSKKWMLTRKGYVMGIGPDADNFWQYWGLENNGKRPCVFGQSWTFNADGTFDFDDGGYMWGDNIVFVSADNPQFEVCIPAAEFTVNDNGDDITAWLSGTHDFTYDPSAGTLTVSGEGAWMGLISRTASGDVIVPQNEVTYDVSIGEGTLYDSMLVSLTYPNGDYWQFNYVSYYDWANQPDVVTEEETFGEDLADITPTEIKATFASKDAADLVTIDTITSGSTLEFGVDDPTDAAAAKVGQFNRVAGTSYQELQFQASPEAKDIQFDNFTTAKIDIFVPESTVFEDGGLVRQFVFGIADKSQTEEWWNSPEQYLVEGTDFVVGAWTTYTFDLSTTDVLTRTDLDMLYLGIGGGGHNAGGTFYVRNLIFE